jgi:hypothetical protein
VMQYEERTGLRALPTDALWNDWECQSASGDWRNCDHWRAWVVDMLWIAKFRRPIPEPVAARMTCVSETVRAHSTATPPATEPYCCGVELPGWTIGAPITITVREIIPDADLVDASSEGRLNAASVENCSNIAWREAFDSMKADRDLWKGKCEAAQAQCVANHATLMQEREKSVLLTKDLGELRHVTECVLRRFTGQGTREIVERTAKLLPGYVLPITFTLPDDTNPDGSRKS